MMEVEGAGDTDRGLVLEPREARRRNPTRHSAFHRATERSSTRICPAKRCEREPKRNCAQHEPVQTDAETKAPGQERDDDGEGESR